MIPQYSKKQILASYDEPIDTNVLWLDLRRDLEIKVPILKYFNGQEWIALSVFGDISHIELIDKNEENEFQHITQNQKDKLNNLENYIHPVKHPTSILNGVDTISGATDKYLNERGNFTKPSNSYSHSGLTDKNAEPEYQHITQEQKASLHTHTNKASLDNYNPALFATASQGEKADSALQSLPPNIVVDEDYSALKDKVNGIEENANNYEHPIKHPTSILEGVSSIGSPLNYLNEKGDFTVPAIRHNDLMSKNTEFKYQHVDTTVTKSVLSSNDKVTIYDSLTGKIVLTYKTNIDIQSIEHDDTLNKNDNSDFLHITQAEKELIASTAIMANANNGYISDLQEDKADKATTLSGYGITDAYTKDEIDNKVSAVYKFKGNVNTYADLPATNQVVGDVYNVNDTGINYAWDGAEWDNIGGVEPLATSTNNGLMSKEDFSKLAGIEAGAEVNNISDLNVTDLTDGGDTNLHYHSADRNRVNHTGTQPASTISDFDTEVANNTTVSANTSARHTHNNKTVLDNTTASFTVAYQNKLNGIQEGAEANVNADWNASSGDAQILNKPTSMPSSDVYAWAKAPTKPTYNAGEIGGLGANYRWLTDAYITTWNAKEPAIVKLTAFNKNFGTTAGTVSEGNHTHTFASLTSKPNTISGYGITDAYTKTEIDTSFENHKTYSNVTYEDLIVLISNNKLVPNSSYRITNYTTTTVQADTQSAGHDFDIIVTALSTNELSEDAKCVRKSGDTYFANAKLEAWEIKYCIDNDTTRFAWADTINGKGVIYYMKDEWSNECPYDFKNIQFKKSEVFLYTFGGATDGSLTGVCQHNSMRACVSGYVFELNFNTFGIYCSNNTFGNNCWYNTFGTNCYSNTFGNSCNGNTFGTNCYSNTFGTNCYSNTFGNSCNGNIFGIDCNNNTFVASCTSNTFGNTCTYNSFGDTCNTNTFGIACSNNIFGVNCSNNTFGNSCEYNKFGEVGGNCNSNTLGNECSNNTFGDTCNTNTFGTTCSNNIFGNSFQSNTFGDKCSSNTSGDICTNNTFGDSCANNTLNNNFQYNSFGIICQSNTFGNKCHLNTFGDTFQNNTLGDECHSNTFGNYCTYNELGSYCQNNTFGNRCSYNNFGNTCKYNTFGNICNSNTFANTCYFNTFGNICESNTFGNKCDNNTFGNRCSYNNFYAGTSGTTKKDYISYIVLEDGCRYNNFYSTLTTSLTSYLQRIRIKGLENTTATDTQITLSATNTKYEWLVCYTSTGELKQYCPND